ncbi:MAG TPA: hypothetical protein VFH68_21555 [Polyangia bacterium]|jgi:hypothetical protein|nr:hypothetical protein [Polyangia bacterium]
MGPRIVALLLWLPLGFLLLGGRGAGAATAPRSRAHAKASAHPAASGKSQGKTTPASAKARPSAKAARNVKPAKSARAVREAVEVKPPPLPARADGKVAVFVFDGDGAEPLRARVVRLLRARGLKVTTTLRPVDSAEQYREMADTLKLAAFVDGESSEDGDQASITVYLRSGVSGLRIASATLASARRALPGEVDKSLWPQLGPPLARVCVEAAKPRKREREPMRIEAGTPLEPTPPEPSGAPLVKKGG